MWEWERDYTIAEFENIGKLGTLFPAILPPHSHLFLSQAALPRALPVNRSLIERVRLGWRWRGVGGDSGGVGLSG